jgi:hypothetical protein
MLLRSLREDVIGDGIPGVVNPYEEQKERPRCDSEQGPFCLGAPPSALAITAIPSLIECPWSPHRFVDALSRHRSDNGNVEF